MKKESILRAVISRRTLNMFPIKATRSINIIAFHVEGDNDWHSIHFSVWFKARIVQNKRLQRHQTLINHTVYSLVQSKRFHSYWFLPSEVIDFFAVTDK